ncbi:MAG: exosome complex exonuclease Rrp41 [archaeon]
MGGLKSEVPLIQNGRRVDGRRFDELRPIKMEVGVLNNADGSAYVEWGKNKILAAVYGPRECLPRHEQDPYKAKIRYSYSMLSFSVSERKRPGPDRRSIEISKVSRDVFEKVIFSNQFPKTEIQVYVDILQADAGTRCAAITASSLALADAGIPMRTLVPACTAGKVEGHLVLDICSEEDVYGQADFPIAIDPRNKNILLMQLDGILTLDEFLKLKELAISGAMQVYEMQKKVLKDKFFELGDSNGKA